MKLNIVQKLLIVSALPIITLVIFSAIYISDKYALLSNSQYELTKLHVIKNASSLIHELQIERGISASYLNKNDDDFFTANISLQRKKTDLAMHNFLSEIRYLDKKHISLSSQKYINDTLPMLKAITAVRTKILSKTISADLSFEYFTKMNALLISVLNGFKVHSSNADVNMYTMTLKQLIDLQEFAGQERALIAKLTYISKITQIDMRHFHTLRDSQINSYKNINFILQNSIFENKLTDVHKHFLDSYYHFTIQQLQYNETKKYLLFNIYKTIGYGGMIHKLKDYKKTKNPQYYQEFLEKKVIFDGEMKNLLHLLQNDKNQYKVAIELKKSFDSIQNINPLKILKLYQTLQSEKLHINSKEWFEISTARINKFHIIEAELLVKISQSINNSIEETHNALIIQILLTIVTIIALLIGTFRIANKIKYSIEQLNQGLNDFFSFLNFTMDKPKNINTHSNDEINDMAQHINHEMSLIEERLQEDKDFIHEATQVVMMMKDGDFSERPYFEPHNPHLIELKAVLNELIDLISQKIKEQTTSLERLNSSLEDRVYHQTIELEQQIQEITDSRDKAVRAEIAKDEFLANMSHEIRTPLNAILGFVSILKKRIEEEKSLNYLNIIDTSGQSLLTIINDILDFSKIQSGKFAITLAQTNPLEEFSNAILLFASKAYEKHLDYSVYIDPNMPQSVNIDIVRVKQILSNILSNAIKFTHEDGQVQVKIFFEDSQLIISVEDNGIGIDKENISKVFSAFEQADGSTTRKYGGTGLGLSISSKLAQLMNGKLSLESELGKGTTFTLTLPVEILNAQPLEFLEKDELKNFNFAILSSTVDDIKVKLIKTYLQEFGFNNVIEITQYQEDGYDLLFFIPDDGYNEEIVMSSKKAIAVLLSQTIKLANLEHIQPLYIPLTPKSILKSITDSKIKQEPSSLVEEIQAEDLEEEIEYNGTILVAEDNKTNQMLISLILDDYDIDFKIANNGLEAVEMFKEQKYDIVLMDENMPELNGIGAMKIIKKYEEENNLPITPIVALTASVLEKDKEMFINAGMDGFVGKPINTKELEIVLDQYLTRKS